MLTRSSAAAFPTATAFLVATVDVDPLEQVSNPRQSAVDLAWQGLIARRREEMRRVIDEFARRGERPADLEPSRALDVLFGLHRSETDLARQHPLARPPRPWNVLAPECLATPQGCDTHDV